MIINICKFLSLWLLFLSPTIVQANNTNLIDSLLNNGWHWSSLGSTHLNNLNIQAFMADVRATRSDITKTISQDAGSVFQQLQIIKDSLVLSGIYRGKHYLVQIIAISKDTSRVLLSSLSSATGGPYFTFAKYLPAGTEAITHINNSDTAMHSAVLIFKAGQPVTQLLRHVGQLLIQDGWNITMGPGRTLYGSDKDQQQIGLQQIDLPQGTRFIFWYQGAYL